MSNQSSKLGITMLLSLAAMLLLVAFLVPKFQKERGEENEKKKFPEMILVKGGTFAMGTNQGDTDECPVHKVTLTSFYIAKYEVTHEQYELYCDSTGLTKIENTGSGRDDYPIVNITWDQASAYCAWLSKRSGKLFRLPTEAEWEYAARGGNMSRDYTHSGSDIIDDIGWYNMNSESKTHAVGQKLANELGIYDMTGNVWEWCQDRYGRYSADDQINPQGASKGNYRVCRGGNFMQDRYDCRSVARDCYLSTGSNPTLGFRVARDL